LDDFGLNTSTQKLGSMSVPQIMKTNAWDVLQPPYETPKLACDTFRKYWLAVGSGTQQSVAGLPNALLEQFLSLFMF